MSGGAFRPPHLAAAAAAKPVRRASPPRRSLMARALLAVRSMTRG
jgi:hypothetical protein